VYDRDALLAAVDLRQLADELLGPHAGTARSPMWRCSNPHHSQTGRTPPVSVFTSRRGEQRWQCHGCGEGGTAIDLVLHARGGSIREALGYLAGKVGHHDVGADWEPRPRRTATVARPSHGCRDPAGLQRYVDDCVARLWQPSGRPIHCWLTDTRGIPPDILRANRIGADLGPRAQPRPDGMPKATGAVLPVISRGRAVYAQIRVPHPRGEGPRYLNPTAELTANPRLARLRPATRQREEVIVTEGTIDALSAAAGGYRSVALLSATYGDEAVALALARLPHPLVLALDADDAGRAGAERLAALLEARQRPPAILDLGEGDLNDSMRRAADWPAKLASTIGRVTRASTTVCLER
jgi:Toprim-like